MKNGPESELLERYLDRLEKAGRQLGMSGMSVTVFNESRMAQPDRRKSEEASMMLGALKPGGLLIALDEHGSDIGSPEFSAHLKSGLENGCPEMAFAIGGPDGHGPELLQRANQTLRLGRMTWPHQLARVMLAEQLYRAITILSGHPYHRN